MINNEDIQRKMEFIVEQQAQFAADMQRLEESQARTDQVVAEAGESLAQLGESVTQVAVAVTQVADVVARLAEPLVAPLRRFIPLVGGIDLSPLAAIVLLQVAGMIAGGVLGSLLR